MNTTGDTILVMGGTSGIGLELAREFYKLGNQVIIVGRRKALIDSIVAAHPGMDGYVLDVTDGNAIRELATQLATSHPKLNVLVNNAGVMPIEDLTATRMIRTPCRWRISCLRPCGYSRSNPHRRKSRFSAWGFYGMPKPRGVSRTLLLN